MIRAWLGSGRIGQSDCGYPDRVGRQSFAWVAWRLDPQTDVLFVRPQVIWLLIEARRIYCARHGVARYQEDAKMDAAVAFGRVVPVRSRVKLVAIGGVRADCDKRVVWIERTKSNLRIDPICFVDGTDPQTRGRKVNLDVFAITRFRVSD